MTSLTLGVLGVFPTSLSFRTKDCAVQSLVYLMGGYGLLTGKPDMALSVCSPNTHNIEAGGSRILGHPWLQRVRGLPGIHETLSQNSSKSLSFIHTTVQRCSFFLGRESS